MNFTKYAKTLLVLAAFGLPLAAGLSSAPAAVLCTSEASPCPAGQDEPSGTAISATLATGTKTKLATTFKTVECSKSSISGSTSNTGGSETEVKITVETLTIEECNCEVKILAKGLLFVNTAAPHQGTVFSSGEEITISCSTIIGTVHCKYVTENTHYATIIGGNLAKIKKLASLIRLPTSAACAEKAEWSGEYEITKPHPLFVEAS